MITVWIIQTVIIVNRDRELVDADRLRFGD